MRPVWDEPGIVDNVRQGCVLFTSLRSAEAGICQRMNGQDVHSRPSRAGCPVRPTPERQMRARVAPFTGPRRQGSEGNTPLLNKGGYQPPPPPPPPPPPDEPPPPLPELEPGGEDAEEIADEKELLKLSPR